MAKAAPTPCPSRTTCKNTSSPNIPCTEHWQERFLPNHDGGKMELEARCKQILSQQKWTVRNGLRTAVLSPLLGLDTYCLRAGQNQFCRREGWGNPPHRRSPCGTGTAPLDHDSGVPSPSFAPQKPEQWGCAVTLVREKQSQQPWSVPRVQPLHGPVSLSLSPHHHPAHAHILSRVILAALPPQSRPNEDNRSLLVSLFPPRPKTMRDSSLWARAFNSQGEQIHQTRILCCVSIL